MYAESSPRIFLTGVAAGLLARCAIGQFSCRRICKGDCINSRSRYSALKKPVNAFSD